MSDQVNAGVNPDGVATLLEIAGWICAILSVGGAFMLYAQESSNSYSSDPADPTAAIVLGGVGLLLSLLILGVARVINYTRSAALDSKRTVQLLQIAVDRDE